jgi:hypothetical protein
MAACAASRGQLHPVTVRYAKGMRVQPTGFPGPGLCTALTIGNVLAAAVRLTGSNAERSID